VLLKNMDKKKKKPSFNLPKGYFESLNDRIRARLGEEPDFVLPKNDGFKLPEGYLENLNQTLKEKLEGKETKVFRLNPKRSYFYAAASIAAIILMLLGWYWIPEKEITFGDLAQSDIENYFEDKDLKLSSYELAEALSLEEMGMNTILDNDIVEEGIIMEYLDETIDTIEELNITTDDYEE
ncbi:MAG: hypothetical protein AAFX53_07920, partial [Bacteroidota bacterium]